MFSMFAAPVLLVECALALVLAAIGLLAVIRIDRVAGLALAAAGTLYALAVIAVPTMEIGALGVFAYLSQGASGQPNTDSAMAMAVGLVVATWLGPIGRSIGLGTLAYVLIRLSRKVPPELHDRPPS